MIEVDIAMVVGISIGTVLGIYFGLRSLKKDRERADRRSTDFPWSKQHLRRGSSE